MEAKFHLDNVDQESLDKMIVNHPELMILNHIWEIEVEVEGRIESDSFDAHNGLGNLQSYPAGQSAEDLKVTWALSAKELTHTLVETMDLSKEVARLLNERVLKEKKWENISESVIFFKLNDTEKEVVKNLHKAYHSGTVYDITSIINDKAMDQISDDFLKENAE